MNYLRCYDAYALLLCLIIISSSNTQTTQAFKLLINAKWHVHIVNHFGKESLLVRCQSKNNDLGYHVLAPGQEFNWTFRRAIFANTLFFCNLWWKGGHKSFESFRTDDAKMYAMCGGKDCVWAADEDGIYIFHKHQDYEFRFAWDEPIIIPPDMLTNVTTSGTQNN